jgi:simple sugar transport system ATP-binding protein
MDSPIVEVRDISKYFGGVIALNGVSMTLMPNEVMCLLGDNGAGKSTLIKILSGVHQADTGEYLVEGKRVHFNTPRTRDRNRLSGSCHDPIDEYHTQFFPRFRTHER